MLSNNSSSIKKCHGEELGFEIPAQPFSSLGEGHVYRNLFLSPSLSVLYNSILFHLG